MKKRVLIVLIILSLVLFSFEGCSKKENYSNDTQLNENTNATGSTNNGDSITTSVATTFDEDAWLIEVISEIHKEQRTTWNIEMRFLECTEQAIIIEVIDHDNLGFMYSDLYYKLEVLKDGEWIQLSNISENTAYFRRAYVVPSRTEECVDFYSYNLLSGMPDVTLETGHYRLTKRFNSRDFSFEFDMVID